MIPFFVVLSIVVLVLLVLVKLFPLFRIHLCVCCGLLAHTCKLGYIGCLKFGSSTSSENTNTAFLVGVTLSRILCLVVSVVVLIAELPIVVLKAGSFFGFGNNAPVLGDLAVLAGLAVWLVPGIWLLLTLEAAGILPTWMWLLPRIHHRKVVVWAVGIVATLVFFVCFVTVFFMNVYAWCTLQGNNVCGIPVATHMLSVAAFNTMLLPTFVLVIIGIVLGLTSLLGCLLVFLYGVFLSFHFLLDMGKIPAYVAPHNPNTGIRIVEEGGTPLLLPPVQQNEQAVIPPEVPMPDLRTFFFEGFASVGSGLASCFAETAQTMEVEEVVLGYSIVDLDRPIRKTSFPSLHRDLTPYEEIKRVKDKTERVSKGKMSKEAAYTKLAIAANRHILDVCGEKQGVTVVVATPLALLPSLCEPLCKLKDRLFHPHILVVTTRSQRDEVIPDLDLCIRSLSRVGIETYVYDADSDYVTSHADEAHAKAVAGTILGASVAHMMHEQNMTFAEVGEQLRTYSAGIGLAFAQAQVADGKRASWLYALLAKVFRKMGSRGNGDFPDLVAKAKNCTEDVIDEVERAGNGNSTIPFFVYTIPVSFADKRFGKFIEQIQKYLRDRYPDATPIVTWGNMPEVKGMEGRFRCGVCGFVPLSPASPFSSIGSRDEEKTRTLSPVEKTVVIASNGAVPQESTSENTVD
jgi:hypothetical protein